jgi:hypothetical protein
MAKKNLETRSGSPRRNQQRAVRIDIDFEDLLAVAVASVIIFSLQTDDLALGSRTRTRPSRKDDQRLSVNWLTFSRVAKLDAADDGS